MNEIGKLKERGLLLGGWVLRTSWPAMPASVEFYFQSLLAFQANLLGPNKHNVQHGIY